MITMITSGMICSRTRQLIIFQESDLVFVHLMMKKTTITTFRCGWMSITVTTTVITPTIMRCKKTSRYSFVLIKIVEK